MSRQPERREFDGYASEYEALIDEPARKWFAGVEFFHRRKLEVLQTLLRKRGRDTPGMRWLDFGCGKGDLLRIGQVPREFRVRRFSGNAGRGSERRGARAACARGYPF